MGVSIGTKIKYFSQEKEFLKKFDLEDTLGEYVFDFGLIADGGSEYEPSNSDVNFTNEEKDAMKIFFDEESMSVGEGYAKVIPNIQEARILLNAWVKIRSSIFKSIRPKMRDYENSIKNDINTLKQLIEDNNNKPTGIFSKKEKITIPELTKQISLDMEVTDTLWKIDSISKIIGILMVAKENKYLVEITASDW